MKQASDCLPATCGRLFYNSGKEKKLLYGHTSKLSKHLGDRLETIKRCKGRERKRERDRGRALIGKEVISRSRWKCARVFVRVCVYVLSSRTLTLGFDFRNVSHSCFKKITTDNPAMGRIVTVRTHARSHTHTRLHVG